MDGLRRLPRHRGGQTEGAALRQGGSRLPVLFEAEGTALEAIPDGAGRFATLEADGHAGTEVLRADNVIASAVPDRRDRQGLADGIGRGSLGDLHQDSARARGLARDGHDGWRGAADEEVVVGAAADAQGPARHIHRQPAERQMHVAEAAVQRAVDQAGPDDGRGDGDADPDQPGRHRPRPVRGPPDRPDGRQEQGGKDDPQPARHRLSGSGR